MPLPKRYHAQEQEPALQQRWQAEGTYHFDAAASPTTPLYAIDTPPPTVSGHLHLGHTYSYSHTDFMARFFRMNGYNIFYPMGYDDNGLPTERLVEKWEGVKAADIGREAFIQRCLAVSEKAEQEYQALWQRLGLSVDWRYTYRTIDDNARRISQWSFLDLYHKGLVYRQQAPAIWCPLCQTAIAQADVDDMERASEFVTLPFGLPDGTTLPIATTRPELLPACVAIFVHPDDARYAHLLGQQATVPLLGQAVPILADPGADPQKGTGAVMCCTFGDTADVAWWRTHHLPLIEAIGRDGRMTTAAAPYTGLTITQARAQIKRDLEQAGLLLERQGTEQTIRVHERCDTPVEFIVAGQWFIRVLAYKKELLAAAEQITWHPAHMKTRYIQWVEGLGWDWGISRQRYFGVTFPLWTCATCGEAMLADEDQLPLDPTTTRPRHACACGSNEFIPETDVMDTWATSSMSPRIAAQLIGLDGELGKTKPFGLRPQAHEIIRTWAFYTIVKSLHHTGTIPFDTIALSGWGLAPAGTGKISKSRGGGPMAPMTMIEKYSADAVRYWAASTGLGKDSTINEEKIQAGAKLVTKLWNVAQFAQRFLPAVNDQPPAASLAPTDRWLLSPLHRLIQRVTLLWQQYDYATAKSETELFFWQFVTDNYLELVKHRLYDEAHPQREGAIFTLHHTLLTLLKLFAPILPYVTEAIYLGLFAEGNSRELVGTQGNSAESGQSAVNSEQSAVNSGQSAVNSGQSAVNSGQSPVSQSLNLSVSQSPLSLHTTPWPICEESWLDEDAERLGNTIIELATAVRRYKSEQNLSVGQVLAGLGLVSGDEELVNGLVAAATDIQSITRAQFLTTGPLADGVLLEVEVQPGLHLSLRG
ncbi:MAG: valine--tRNA ligase [Chloroflexi bacterium]|nr:valine--tRNA ligase [Chloroflexota bacterium]MBP8059402.1 valine--tRNA ligase [Chloroflexota bacterium]